MCQRIYVGQAEASSSLARVFPILIFVLQWSIKSLAHEEIVAKIHHTERIRVLHDRSMQPEDWKRFVEFPYFTRIT